MSTVLNIEKKRNESGWCSVFILFSWDSFQQKLVNDEVIWALLIKSYHPMYDEMSWKKTQTQYQSQMNSHSVSEWNFPHHFQRIRKHYKSEYCKHFSLSMDWKDFYRLISYFIFLYFNDNSSSWKQKISGVQFKSSFCGSVYLESNILVQNFWIWENFSAS